MNGGMPGGLQLQVVVVPSNDSWVLRINGKVFRTPGERTLKLPTRRLAMQVKKEWDSLKGQMNAEAMPITNMCNTALDRIAPDQETVCEIVSEYGATDLLCYRAASPSGLEQRQRAGWDPVLAWARTSLGISLKSVTGMLPIVQPEASLDQIRQEISCYCPFELAGLAEIVTTTGSAILGLAYMRSFASAEQIWDLSVIDESWQFEHWGKDDESMAALAAKRRSFLAGCKLIDAIRKHSAS